MLIPCIQLSKTLIRPWYQSIYVLKLSTDTKGLLHVFMAVRISQHPSVTYHVLMPCFLPMKAVAGITKSYVSLVFIFLLVEPHGSLEPNYPWHRLRPVKIWLRSIMFLHLRLTTYGLKWFHATHSTLPLDCHLSCTYVLLARGLAATGLVPLYMALVGFYCKTSSWTPIG